MSRMRELTEQYRAEAERIGALIDNLRADGGALNSETRKRLDVLYTMRRENLATYRHLLDYCAAVDNKHKQTAGNTYGAASKRVTQSGQTAGNKYGATAAGKRVTQVANHLCASDSNTVNKRTQSRQTANNTYGAANGKRVTQRGRVH